MVIISTGQNTRLKRVAISRHTPNRMNSEGAHRATVSKEASPVFCSRNSTPTAAISSPMTIRLEFLLPFMWILALECAVELCDGGARLTRPAVR